jgi:hypothetical protein
MPSLSSGARTTASPERPVDHLTPFHMVSSPIFAPECSTRITGLPRAMGVRRVLEGFFRWGGPRFTALIDTLFGWKVALEGRFIDPPSPALLDLLFRAR